MLSQSCGIARKIRDKQRMLRVALCLLLAFVEPVLADKALDAIAKQIAQPELLQGQFEQRKTIRILAMPLVSTGEFSVLKNQGVIWQVQKPIASQLLISSDGIKGADLGENRAMSHVGKILNQLLSGNLAVLEEQFTVTVIQQDANAWALKLVPRSIILQKAISEIELNGGRHIQQLVLKEATGDQTQVIFTGFVESPTIPGSISHVFTRH